MLLSWVMMFAPEQTTEQTAQQLQHESTWWTISTCKLSLRTRSRTSLSGSVCLFTLLNFLEKSSEMMKCRGSCEDIWGRSHGNAESCVVTQKRSKGTCEDMKTDSSKQWIKSAVNLNKHLSAGGRGGDVDWRRSGGWMSQPGDIINDLMYGTFTCSQLFQTSFRCDDALDESKFPDKWPQSLVPTFMFLRGCFVHSLPAQPFHQPQLDFHVSC